MKPTTIDGREVLWHGVVDDNRYPGEVAVVPGAFGDVTVYGKHGSRWIPNSGNRAAVRLLLAEVERLQAQLADARKMGETQCQIRYAETEEKERLQRENAELREALDKLVDHVCGDMGTTDDNPYIQAARSAMGK